MTPDLSFPDLRSFLDQLRRDGDLAVVEAEVDPRLEAAEIHRRVIAAGGPALLFTKVARRGLAARHQPLRHRPPGRAGVRHAAGAARQAPRPPRRDADAADGRQAVGRARRRPRGAAHRPREARARAGHGGRDRRRAPRPPARADLLARGRRPVRHAAARLHRAPRRARAAQPRHVPPAGPRRAHDRHALADRQGRRLPLRRGRGARREPAGHRLPRRPARADPRRDRAAARERARADAGLAHRRRAPRALPGPGPHPLVASAEFALVGHVPARVRRPEGPFGDHYGYYSLRHDYPVFHVRHAVPAPRRDLPGHRRRQAAAGGLLHRRPAAGAALAALPAGDAGGRGPLVLRRDRLPLARRRGRAASATSARRWPRPSASSARDSSRSRSSCSSPTGASTCATSARRSSTCSRARNPRPTSTSSRTCRWTRSTTRGRRSTRARRACGSASATRCASCRGSSARERRPRPRSPTCASSAAAASWWAGPSAAEDPARRPRLAAHPAFAGWPLARPHRRAGRAAASPMNFLWTTFTRFEPAADIHAAATRVVRHHVVHEPPVLIDARMKPCFPREVSCDPETAALVSRRWREYFPAAGSRWATRKGPPRHPARLSALRPLRASARFAPSGGLRGIERR